jgi:DNA mismatch repair protein MutS
MMAQYRRIKDQHPTAIVFFRLGDFYETFFEDAATVARELEITLTSREAGRGGRVPMAGIPHHAAEGYLARLLDRGYRVAICDQVEDPAAAKGLVRREVTRVVTPGTTVDPRALDERTPNYLAVVATANAAQGGDELLGLALCDFSTGEFRATEWRGATAWQELVAELALAAPREVLVDPRLAAAEDRMAGLAKLGLPAHQALAAYEPHPARAARALAAALGTVSLAAFGLADRPAATAAAAALVGYLKQTQLETAQVPAPRYWDRTGRMTLDATAQRQLELAANARDGKRTGSLLWAVDLTQTPMGGRLLRAWLLAPLTELQALRARQARVAAFVQQAFLRAEVRGRLRSCPDLARLVSRASAGLAGARDLVAVGLALALVPQLVGALDGAPGSEPIEGLVAHPELEALLARALADSPPAALGEGGLIRDGYDPEVDRLRALRQGGKGWLAGFEAGERQRTGIRSLRVGYNRVFGYYIEVTRPNLAQVPGDYVRRQTLATGERFVTEELKQRESEILGAEERLYAREYELFLELRGQVAAASPRLLSLAAAIAELDCHAALAELAVMRGYVRPELTQDVETDIEAGRHPVLETTIETGFVANDLCMGGEDGPRVLVITGPNMAGKSTYLRQAALLTLLAQIGSYVPAKRARIGLVDRVFTRIGAHDDLAAGQSTFMVEMQEVAHILRHATARSLVILDEVGRGTSTFDGISLARAVVEHLAGVGCRTLFATHYHELIGLAASLDTVANFSTAVLDRGGEIVFPHKVRPGGADRSYGIEVARLAGLPPSVLARAKALLSGIELAEREVAAASDLWLAGSVTHPSEPPGRPAGAAGAGGPAGAAAAGGPAGAAATWPAGAANAWPAGAAGAAPSPGGKGPQRGKPSPQQISFLEPPPSPVLEELRALDVFALTPLQALNLLARWQEQVRRSGGGKGG